MTSAMPIHFELDLVNSWQMDEFLVPGLSAFRLTLGRPININGTS